MADINKLIDNNKWNKIYKLIKKDIIKPDETINNNNNLLHLACMNNNDKVIKIITDKYPDLIYKSNNEGNTCAHILANNGYENILKKLIKKYPKLVELENDKGNNILKLIKDNNELVKWVLQKTQINDNHTGYLVLDYIKKSEKKDKFYDTIHNLLKDKIDLSKPEQNPPLIYATKLDKYYIVKLLLEYGADTNIKDKKYLSSLIYAVNNNNIKIVKELIKYGADLNYSGAEGDYNPLMIAIDKNNTEMIELLLSHNININIFNRYFDTPAHVAVLNKELSKNILFKILFLSNLNILNIDKKTPLQLLIENHNWKDYIEILKVKKINLENNDIINLLKQKKEYDEFMSHLDKSKVIFENKLNNILLKTNYTNHGKFNSNMIHSMIYTIIILSKYQNVSVPYQYFNPNKANTDRKYVETLCFYKSKEGLLINSLVKSYTNLFYQITPYLILWRDENNYFIHPDLKFHMLKSLLSDKVRFIVLKLTLITEQASSHANIILYDKETGYMERFDPYGDVIYLNTKTLDESLEKYFKKFLEKKNFKLKYLSPQKLFNGISFQILSNDENDANKKLGDPVGYCLAWTFWYLEQRITHPNIKPQSLVRELYKEIFNHGKNYKDNPFINYIRNYANILDTIKNNFMISSGVKVEEIYDIVISDSNLKAILSNLIKTFKILMGSRIIY